VRRPQSIARGLTRWRHPSRRPRPHLGLALASLAAALLACPATAPAPPGLEPPASTAWPPTVADLAWLEGTWRGVAGELAFVERWLAPADGSVLGVGEHSRAGRMVTRETMRIMADGRGLTLVVMLDSGQVTHFELTAVGPDGFRAVRRDDGFPRALDYRRAGPGRMTVTLLGDDPARSVTIPFALAPPGALASPGGDQERAGSR